MASWEPLAIDTDEDDQGPTRFIVDNDVDVELFRAIQGTGASVVQLPPRFRSQPDDIVLAEAKRQNRVLITHDRRFVNPLEVERIKNPGVVILPRDKHGRLDWSLVMSILSYAVQSRYSLDQTVVQVYPSGRFTIWNPNEYTDEMEAIYCRVTEDPRIEVWLDDDGGWGREPEY